jgi:hypothetical protein
MEDDLQWKMTFNGRYPSMEDDLQWKMNFENMIWKIEENQEENSSVALLSPACYLLFAL